MLDDRRLGGQLVSPPACQVGTNVITLAHTWDRPVRNDQAASITLDGTGRYATVPLPAGVLLRFVSERLGDSSIQITADTYQHVLDHMRHEAAVRVGQIFGP